MRSSIAFWPWIHAFVEFDAITRMNLRLRRVVPTALTSFINRRIMLSICPTTIESILPNQMVKESTTVVWIIHCLVFLRNTQAGNRHEEETWTRTVSTKWDEWQGENSRVSTQCSTSAWSFSQSDLRTAEISSTARFRAPTKTTKRTEGTSHRSNYDSVKARCLSAEDDSHDVSLTSLAAPNHRAYRSNCV